MSFDLADTRIDEKKVEEGVWCALERLHDGRIVAEPVNKKTPENAPQVLIRAPGIAYLRAMEKLKEGYKSAIRSGKLTDAQDAEIVGKALVRGGVLLGWKNIVIDKEVIHWSPASAEKILGDIRYSNFRGVLSAIADNRALLLEKEFHDDLGNSSAGSTGQCDSPDLTGNSSKQSQKEGSD